MDILKLSYSCTLLTWNVWTRNLVKYHDSEQWAVFGFNCGLSSVMYCKANIKVTSLNEYSDSVMVSLCIAIFQAKDKHKGCGQLQVTVLERSYVATKCNCCHCSVVLYFISSSQGLSLTNQQRGALCYVHLCCFKCSLTFWDQQTLKQVF